MTTSANKGFVKLLLRRAQREWKEGRAPEDTLKTVASMIRNQFVADEAAQNAAETSKGNLPSQQKITRTER